MGSALRARNGAILSFILLLLTACAPGPETVDTAAFTPANPSPTAIDLPARATVPPGPPPTADSPSATPTTMGTSVPPGLGEEVAVSLGMPVIMGHGIRVAAFSPDGETVAIGWTNGISLMRSDDQIDLWFRQMPDLVTAVATSGTHVVALLVTGDVWLFEASSGDGQAFKQAAISSSIWGDAAWSPDGRLAAIQNISGGGGNSSPILILDPNAGTIRELPNSGTNPGVPPELRWSPDSRMIAAVDPNGRAWVLDVITGEVAFPVQEAGGMGQVRISGWLPDSQIVVHNLPDGDSGLAILDVGTDELVMEVRDVPAGYMVAPPIILAQDSPLALVGSGYNGFSGEQIHPYVVWDLAAGQALEAPPVGGMGNIAVAFNGEKIHYLFPDGRLERWLVGASEGELLGRVPVYYPNLGGPLVWSSDSMRLALSTEPGSAITVWDVATGRLIAARYDGTQPVAIDDSLLAYRGLDEQLILWDLDRDVAAHVLPGPVAHFCCERIAFSRDGDLLAYAAGKSVHVVDLASGQIMAALDADAADERLTYIRWSPGGDALGAAGSNGTLFLWEKDGSSFQEIWRWEDVRPPSSSDFASPPLFSPSGDLVAFQQLLQPDASEYTVIVYDRSRHEVILAKKGNLQQWLSDENLLITSVDGYAYFIELYVHAGEKQFVGTRGTQAEPGSYAPDKVHAASSTFDGSGVHSIAITNWRTGQEVAAAYLGSSAWNVHFSPNGRWLAARNAEGQFIVWPVFYTGASDE